MKIVAIGALKKRQRERAREQERERERERESNESLQKQERCSSYYTQVYFLNSTGGYIVLVNPVVVTDTTPPYESLPPLTLHKTQKHPPCIRT